MSKYIDIINSIKPIEIEENTEEVTTNYVFAKQYKKNNYNRWVYTYYPYLERLYNELVNEFDLKIPPETLFKLLYEKSSGEISKYI